MPVWHASVSIQRKGRFVADRPRLERLAIAALRGVGGEAEWWIDSLMLNGPAVVGHLRVAITPAEYAMVPFGIALNDAGETGPRRARTR